MQAFIASKNGNLAEALDRRRNVGDISDAVRGSEFAADLLVQGYDVLKLVGENHAASGGLRDGLQPNANGFQIFIANRTGESLIDHIDFFDAGIPIYRYDVDRNPLAFDRCDHVLESRLLLRSQQVSPLNQRIEQSVVASVGENHEGAAASGNRRQFRRKALLDG